MRAIDSESGLPFSIVNFRTGKSRNPGWTSGKRILSEIGSFQLEFIALSEASGDDRFKAVAVRSWETLLKLRHLMGYYLLWLI